MRLVLCDARRSFLEATGAALSARGHEVLAASQDPDTVPELLAALPPEVAVDACVLDTSYDGTARLDALVPVFLALPRPLLVVLSDAAPAPVWRALDDGVIGALVAKSVPHDELHRVLERASGGEVVVVGHARATVRLDPLSWPPAGLHPRLDALTDLDRRLLGLVADHVPTRVIAARLGIPVRAARVLVGALLEQLLPPGQVTGSGPVPPDGTGRPGP